MLTLQFRPNSEKKCQYIHKCRFDWSSPWERWFRRWSTGKGSHLFPLPDPFSCLLIPHLDFPLLPVCIIFNPSLFKSALGPVYVSAVNIRTMILIGVKQSRLFVWGSCRHDGLSCSFSFKRFRKVCCGQRRETKLSERLLNVWLMRSQTQTQHQWP